MENWTLNRSLMSLGLLKFPKKIKAFNFKTRNFDFETYVVWVFGKTNFYKNKIFIFI